MQATNFSVSWEDRIDERKSVVEQSGLEYPIVYKVVTWVRVLIVSGALVFGLGWSYTVLFPPYAHGTAVFDPMLIGVGVLVIGALAYGVAWALTSQISLYADRFEQRKPFIHRVLRIDDILGRRYTTGRGSGYPMIVPKSGAAFSIDSTSYGLDGRFSRWFILLPDLQKMERDKYLEYIRSAQSLGTTANERIAANASRLQNLGMIGALLAVVSFALFFIGISNREHVVAFFIVNALLPWVSFVIMVLYRDQMASPDSGKLMFLPVSMLLPALSVGILATENARLVDAKGVAAWSFAVSLMLLLLGRTMLTDRSKAGPGIRGAVILMLVFLPFTWVYAGGTLALANRTMDTVSPQIVPTKVIGKYVQRGKSSTHYYVRVTGEERLEYGASIRVAGNQYSQVNKGDVVCVAVHPGRFGFPWREPVNCPDKTAPSL